HSNAMIITRVLAAILLLIIARTRRWLAVRRTSVFAACVIAILICSAAIIAHGIAHGTLPTDSLRFRWRYWVASVRIWREHPILGVGWDNFASHYLTVRLPEAAEEIRDPHNLFLRILVELGMIGALLLIFWMLRAGWEATAPIFPNQAPESRPTHGRWLSFLAIASMAI